MKNGSNFRELLSIKLIGYNGETRNVDLTVEWPLYKRTTTQYPNKEGVNMLADRWLKIYNDREQEVARYQSELDKIMRPVTHWVKAIFTYRSI